MWQAISIINHLIFWSLTLQTHVVHHMDITSQVSNFLYEILSWKIGIAWKFFLSFLTYSHTYLSKNVMDHWFFHHVALILVENSSIWRETETGCLSDITIEGIISSLKMKRESWAEWWTTWSEESKVICWEADREKQAFLGTAFICAFVSLWRRWTTLAHPAPWEAAREGRISKGFGSERRQGELWPHSGSPWRLPLRLCWTQDSCHSFCHYSALKMFSVYRS